MNKFIDVNPCNQSMFKVVGYLLWYNKNHVVKYTRNVNAEMRKHYLNDEYYETPSCFDYLWWKIFGGTKPKIKRDRHFTKPHFKVWFSNDEYPFHFMFKSNKDAEEAYNEFHKYMCL